MLKFKEEISMAKTINIENARIGFRNFSGETSPHNRSRERNCVVFLDMDTAKQLELDGWNIKYPKPKDNISPEDDERLPFLPVAVAFENFPPKVILISGETVTRLGEEDISMLDWAEIENVDLVINPYHWEMNGNKGVKAYTKALYVTIVTDKFAEKYGAY